MRLVIAGGGTGGHLFPALAVARAVKTEDPECEIVFVGTERGIEARVIPQTQFPIRFISARGIRGTSLANTIKGAFQVPWGILQSISILREFKAGIVLGVGGYASGPTLMAALLMGIPTAIQEQNSVMGTTNRLMSRFADIVFISWENTEPATSPEKTIVAGNPIRPELLQPAHPGTAIEKDKQKLNILVFGGSQGARSINCAIADNIDQLGPLTQRIAVIHQAGGRWVEEVKEAYNKAGFQADVREFIDDMGAAYEWADLVVCRAGASSLAEITALGKAAVLVPYPHAIGDHQAKNAAFIESRGGAKVVADAKLKNGALVEEIRAVAEDRDLLGQIAANARRLGRPEAARTIALELLKAARSRG